MKTPERQFVEGYPTEIHPTKASIKTEMLVYTLLALANMQTGRNITREVDIHNHPNSSLASINGDIIFLNKWLLNMPENLQAAIIGHEISHAFTYFKHYEPTPDDCEHVEMDIGGALLTSTEDMRDALELVSKDYEFAFCQEDFECISSIQNDLKNRIGTLGKMLKGEGQIYENFGDLVDRGACFNQPETKSR